MVFHIIHFDIKKYTTAIILILHILNLSDIEDLCYYMCLFNIRIETERKKRMCKSFQHKRGE